MTTEESVLDQDNPRFYHTHQQGPDIDYRLVTYLVGRERLKLIKKLPEVWPLETR